MALPSPATTVNDNVLCRTEPPPVGSGPSKPFPLVCARRQSSGGLNRGGQPWKREEGRGEEITEETGNERESLGQERDEGKGGRLRGNVRRSPMTKKEESRSREKGKEGEWHG